jgi:hypothetical protein
MRCPKPLIRLFCATSLRMTLEMSIILAVRSTLGLIIFNKAALFDYKRLQSLRSHTQLE